MVPKLLSSAHFGPRLIFIGKNLPQFIFFGNISPVGYKKLISDGITHVHKTWLIYLTEFTLVPSLFLEKKNYKKETRTWTKEKKNPQIAFLAPQE